MTGTVVRNFAQRQARRCRIGVSRSLSFAGQLRSAMFILVQTCVEPFITARTRWQVDPVPADIDPSRRQLLARLIRERRVARGLSVEGASKAAGIARNTWRAAELGQVVQDGNLGRIEQALAWAPGSVLGVLNGATDEPRSADFDPIDAKPVGSGVDPLDLSVLAPEDQDFLRGIYERLRKQRGE